MSTVAIVDLSPHSLASWDDVAAELDARICLCCGRVGHYQKSVDAHVAATRTVPPVYVEGDKLRDGHHRVVAAIRCGIRKVPVESRSDSGERWLTDHGPVGWLGRRFGDITVSEMSWVATDGLMKLWGAAPVSDPPATEGDER